MNSFNLCERHRLYEKFINWFAGKSLNLLTHHINKHGDDTHNGMFGSVQCFYSTVCTVQTQIHDIADIIA